MGGYNLLNKLFSSVVQFGKQLIYFFHAEILAKPNCFIVGLCLYHTRWQLQHEHHILHVNHLYHCSNCDGSVCMNFEKKCSVFAFIPWYENGAVVSLHCHDMGMLWYLSMKFDLTALEMLTLKSIFHLISYQIFSSSAYFQVKEEKIASIIFLIHAMDYSYRVKSIVLESVTHAVMA